MVTPVAEAEPTRDRKRPGNLGQKPGLERQKDTGGLKYRNGFPDLCF